MKKKLHRYAEAKALALQNKASMLSLQLNADEFSKTEAIERQVMNDFSYYSEEQNFEDLPDKDNAWVMAIRQTPEYIQKITGLQMAHLLPTTLGKLQRAIGKDKLAEAKTLAEITDKIANTMNKNKNPMVVIQQQFNTKKDNTLDITDLKD